jgi:4-amino-4-deoxy-L-arabinose transferase-like glycosyltransferase
MAKEMLDSGDWLIPHYVGEPYFIKPPLLYWLTGLSMWAFGDEEFAVRLPAILSISLTSVIVYWLGSRIFRRFVGFVAGVVFGATVLVVTSGSMLLTDGLLVLFATAAIACWTVSLIDGPCAKRSGVFWVSLSLAFLCKGPAILVFIVPFGLVSWVRQRRGGRNRAFTCIHPGWGAPLCLVMSGWWFALAYISSGDAFVSRFILYDTLARLVTPIEGHWGPPGFYLLTAAAGFLPWFPLMIGASVEGFRRRGGHEGIPFLLIWAFAPWVVLELILTKLPHYVLPCLPALALIQALEFDRLRKLGGEFWRSNLGARAALFVCAVVPSVLAVGAFLVVWRQSESTILAPLGVQGLIGITLGAAAYRQGVKGRIDRAFGIVACSSFLFYQIVGWALLPRFEQYRIGRHYARAALQVASPDDRIIVLGYDEPSLFYYLDRVPTVGPSLEQLDRLVASGPVVLMMDNSRFLALVDWRRQHPAKWNTLEGWNMAKWRWDEGRFWMTPVKLHVGRIDR